MLAGLPACACGVKYGENRPNPTLASAEKGARDTRTAPGWLPTR